jgi:nitroreductase
METTEAILCRRSVRSFTDKAPSDEILKELALCAHRAPSGFNLQPWSFLFVRSPQVKNELCRIALDQKQVKTAPVVLVVIADPAAWRQHYARVLSLSESEGALPPEAIARYKKLIPFYFSPGLIGEYYLVKRILIALRRLVKPTSTLPYSNSAVRAYMREHTMLAAQNYMIAASSKGLGTVSMQGFDEGALKKLLSIPKSMTVPMIIPTGYPDEEALKRPLSVRLPVDDVIRWDSYTDKHT